MTLGVQLETRVLFYHQESRASWSYVLVRKSACFLVRSALILQALQSIKIRNDFVGQVHFRLIYSAFLFYLRL